MSLIVLAKDRISVISIDTSHLFVKILLLSIIIPFPSFWIVFCCLSLKELYIRLKQILKGYVAYVLCTHTYTDDTNG